MKRPPLGLVPKFIWDEARLNEVEGAIKRYKAENLSIPTEWIEEQNALMIGLQERDLKRGPEHGSSLFRV